MSILINKIAIDINLNVSKLHSLPGYQNCSFEDDVWRFQNRNGRLVNINFDDLRWIYEENPGWSVCDLSDLVLLAKCIWISLASKVTIDVYKARLSGLKLFIAALANANVNSMTNVNCSQIIEYILMNSWRNGGAYKNLKIQSSPSFLSRFPFKDVKLLTAELSICFVSQSLSYTSYQKNLKLLIPKLTDNELTYPDWVAGGNLNFLTLDHGKYYVEHCIEFFDEQYPLAFALASTYRASAEIANQLGYSIETTNLILPQILRGYTPEEINTRHPSWTLLACSTIYGQCCIHFESAYTDAVFESSLLRDSPIISFLENCNISTNQSSIDRMRVIIFHWIRSNNIDETERLLLNGIFSLSFDIFKAELNAIKDRMSNHDFKIPSASYYNSIGIDSSFADKKNTSYSRTLIDLVSKAGRTIIVALTGWRASEFGFPSLNILHTLNSDRLDQQSVPWRYHVDWYVYKTSGKIREQREISFGTYLFINRVSMIVSSESGLPCLYRTTISKIDDFDSSRSIRTSVSSLWFHFVKYYSGFKLLDDLAVWKKISDNRIVDHNFTDEEKLAIDGYKVKYSVESYDDIRVDAHLKETWLRVKDEYPQVMFFMISSTMKDKKKWLLNYSNGTLRSDWTAMLDSRLSDDIKLWIKSLPPQDLVAAKVVRAVSSFLVEGAIYPTAHSFRHIWAEAVYRRFDGDAGWMIRSQFKHVSSTMWLAYIRDKDNRIDNDRIKQQVVSSIVRNYLTHQGDGYTGHLHTWLRRLFKKTVVLSPNEQKEIAESLAFTEIENIKSSPWGYCLLRKRTRSKAKCAEYGEPMRHNASPSLCLGCTHNLMQSSNVDWVLFHVSSHVEVLQNKNVPSVFKEASYNLVKNVMLHVRTLDPSHMALNELAIALECYKPSRII